MNKKIIISLSVISIVAAIVIGGTAAYFSDTETSKNNTFAAGTMDLDIDGDDTIVQTMNLSNKAPGDSGSESATLKNSGSLDGELDIAMGVVENYPCTDGANGGQNDGTEYCTSDPGVLGSNAQMALYIDVDESGNWSTNDIGLKFDGTKYINTGSVALDYNAIDNYSGAAWDNVYNGLMAAGDQDGFVIDWKIPTSATNDIQGDALKFDITFTLEQADKD